MSSSAQKDRRAFRSGHQLFGCLLVGGVLVVAALRGFSAVVPELRQLLVEGLDGGVLLAKDFLYQIVAVGFERLLLGEEFIDRIVGHVDYDPIARKAAGHGTAANTTARIKRDSLLWYGRRRFGMQVVEV